MFKFTSKSNSVDVFYFADSFGNLKPYDIKKICELIKRIGTKKSESIVMIIVD